MVFLGAVVEAEVAASDHHEVAAGARSTGRKDLHRQVGTVL